MSRINFTEQTPKDGTFQLPFGKFKGRTIEDVPSDYLKWLRDNSSDEDILEACEAELSYRTDHNAHFHED